MVSKRAMNDSKNGPKKFIREQEYANLVWDNGQHLDDHLSHGKRLPLVSPTQRKNVDERWDYYSAKTLAQ